MVKIMEQIMFISLSINNTGSIMLKSHNFFASKIILFFIGQILSNSSIEDNDDYATRIKPRGVVFVIVIPIVV